MSMVKNEDFKIIKGKGQIETLSVSFKSSKTLFLFYLWNLYSSSTQDQIQR